MEPLDFNFLIAPTVWLQASGTQTDAGPSPRQHEAPRYTYTLEECRAPSRDQGIKGVNDTTNPLCLVEAKSYAQRWGGTGKMGTAKPLLPCPTLSLPS